MRLMYRLVLYRIAPTTHLVFANVMALAAANAHGRRGFGAHRVHSLEPRMVVLLPGALIFVVAGDDNLGATGEWVSDWHDGGQIVGMTSMRVLTDSLSR